MSFNVFLQCFEKGESSGLPREEIRRLLPIVVAESEHDRWSIRYDDLNGCDIYVSALDTDQSLITSMMVSQPCAKIQLWEALFAVMKMGPVVLYFPGNAPPLVVNDQVERDLPREMVEALGPPKVIGRAEEIVEIIKGA